MPATTTLPPHHTRPTPAPDTTARKRMPPDAAADLARIEKLARLLDARYGVPGTRFRFGLDSLVGLIPGIGDTLTLLPSAWMVWRAHQHGLPKSKLARMGINTGLDYAIGLVPVIGDLVDFGFKANLRNAAILREHLETRAAPDMARDVTPG